MIYLNFTAVSFKEPELLPIEVLHCGNREFPVFLRKIVENIKIFCSYRTSDAACMLPELHAFKVSFYAESVSVVTSGHVTKMAVTPLDPQLLKTPCYTQTLRLYLLQNRSYCPLNFLHCGNR